MPLYRDGHVRQSLNMNTRLLPSAAVEADLDWSWLSLPAGIAAAVGVYLGAPLPDDMAAMLAITAFCICLWVGTPVPPWFTALVCVGLIGVVFSTDLALVGFRSAAAWLIVFGILIGEGTRESGLAESVEHRVLALVPARDALRTYRFLLGSLCAAGLALAVLVPSSLVRVLILGPILVSVGGVFTERRAKVGIFLGPLFATYYGSSGILTGSLANIVITGLLESTANIAISWTEWLMWLGPVMGVGRTAAVFAVAYYLYRPEDRSGVADPAEYLEEFEPTGDERRMLAFLFVGVAVWATDFLHGLHPLYGALVVVLLMFAPRIGVVDLDAVADADFSILFFIGAIFAVAEGLKRTDFTGLAAQTILSHLPEGAGLVTVIAFVMLVSCALAFVMEGLAVASVITPTVVSFAQGAGVAVAPVAMAEAVMLNTYFFPYQSAVLVGILGLEVVDSRELVRMATVCSLVTILVLMPVQVGLFLLLT